MSDLGFTCTGVRCEPYAAGPTLLFTLRIEESDRKRVHAVLLRCQIRIEPGRRAYGAGEAERLGDLFGEPARWGSTLKPVQFAHASVTVPGFDGVTEVDLPVACSYDTEVASGAYFRGLEGGEVPLLLLFSGTVFSGARGFTPEPIPWHKEASYRMPVAVWQQMIEQHFPGSGWLRIREDSLERLRRFRADRGLTSWDGVLDTLLDSAERAREAT